MATIYKSIDQIYNISLEKWRLNRGRGTISYDRYLDITKPAVKTIIKYIAANIKGYVVIMVPNTVRANLWEVNISTNMDKPDTFNDRVKLLKVDDVLQKNLKDDVELLIVDSIELYTDHYREKVLLGKYIKFKYSMGLTYSTVPEKLGFVCQEGFELIDKVTKLDLITSRLLSNIDEYMVEIPMSPVDRKQYDFYSEFISETLEMFDDFKTIQNCYIGDRKTGISPDRFREQLAKERGWNKELDLSFELNRNIDRFYAPSNIYERVKTFNEYIQNRTRLLSDNNAKVDAVVEIVQKFMDKKILIINKRGPFAHTISTAINKVIKAPNPPASCNLELFDGGIPTGIPSIIPQVAVEYHLDIEKQPMVDTNTGRPILYKSGVKKGQIKDLGAKSISNINLEGFNNDRHNVICANNALFPDMEIEVDFIIITSTKCAPMEVQQYRVQQLGFINNPTIITLYLGDSQESEAINKSLAKSKHNVTFSTIDELNI